MYTREERLAVAKHVLQQLTPEWAQNPQLKADLKNFVNTGSLESVQDGRIASFLRDIQNNPQGAQNPQYIQQLLRRYGIPILTGYVQDEQVRSTMSGMLTDIANNPSLIGSNADPQQREQYVQQTAMNMVQGMLGSQMSNTNFQRMMAHYQAAGSPSPNDKRRFRQYVVSYLRDLHPGATEQEIQRLADQQIAMIPVEERSVGSCLFSAIPDGCVIPLALLTLFACLASVQIALLFAYIVVTPGINQNPIGSAFNATILILSVGTGVILWMRRQTRSPLHIVRLLVLLGVFGVAIFGLFQIGIIDLEAFADGTVEDQQRMIGSALLILSVGSAVVLWMRRQVMNIVWTIIVIVIIIAAVIFAVQSGIIDIDSILSNVEPTAFE